MNIDQIQSILGAEIECGVFESVVVPALDVCRKVAASGAATVSDAARVPSDTTLRTLVLQIADMKPKYEENVVAGMNLLRNAFAATTAVAQDEWKLAIDNELVTIESTADSFPSPREALAALIDWHVSVALDPAVSKDAQALIDKGRAASSATAPLTSDSDAVETMDADEREEFERTVEDFEDCGETSTDYEVLMDWAQRGLLECTHFEVTKAGQDLIDRAQSTNGEQS